MTPKAPPQDQVELLARAIHAEMLAMETEDGGEGCSFEELDTHQRKAIDRLAQASLTAARQPDPLVEAAWREGWALCKATLFDDDGLHLTDDVEEDAWADSKTRAALSTTPIDGEAG